MIEWMKGNGRPFKEHPKLTGLVGAAIGSIGTGKGCMVMTGAVCMGKNAICQQKQRRSQPDTLVSIPMQVRHLSEEEQANIKEADAPCR